MRSLRTTATLIAVGLVVAVEGLSLVRLHDSFGGVRAEAVPSTHFTPLPPPQGSSDAVLPGLGAPLIDLFDPSHDLLDGGRIVSIGEAARLVPYQMYAPADAALPPPEVWLVRYNAENGQPAYDAALRYDASVVVDYSVWTNGRDPATEYEKMRANWNTGYVTTVGGNPAWVVPAGSPQTLDPRISVVDLSIGDVEVSFLGRVPVEDLLQYAGTLQPAERIAS